MSLSVRSLLIFLIVCPILQLNAAPSLEAWNKLSRADQKLWREVVIKIFPDNLPDDQSYEFHYELGNESRLDWTRHDQRFLELTISQQLKLNELQAEIDDPSTATLVTFVAEVPAIFPTVDRVNLLNIHLRKFDHETTDRLNQRVTDVEGQLKQGVSFGAVAYQLSDARSAGFRGSSGTVQRGTLTPEIDDIIFNLPSGNYAGPFETKYGVNFFQVEKKMPAVNLDRPEDFHRAVNLWKQRELAFRYEHFIQPWKQRDDVSVSTSPLNQSNWLNEPWLSSKDGKISESLGLLYVMTRHSDSEIHEPGEWNAFWADEAQVQAGTVLSYLACYDAFKNDSRLSRSLELARVPYEATQFLRNWQAQLLPSDTDLLKLYESEKDQVAPERTLYTYVELRIPLNTEKTTNVEERREALNELLNTAYLAMEGAQADSRDEAIKIFSDAQTTFPQSRLITIDSMQSEDPLIDPVLARTEPGNFSRPFDHGNSVSVLYVDDKETTRTSFEDSRGVLEDVWRRKQGQKRTQEIRDRIGIR